MQLPAEGERGPPSVMRSGLGGFGRVHLLSQWEADSRSIYPSPFASLINCPHGQQEGQRGENLGWCAFHLMHHRGWLTLDGAMEFTTQLSHKSLQLHED